VCLDGEVPDNSEMTATIQFDLRVKKLSMVVKSAGAICYLGSGRRDIFFMRAVMEN